MPGYHVHVTNGGDNDTNPSAAGYLEFGTDQQNFRPVRLNSDGSISFGPADGSLAPDTVLARSAAGQLTINGSAIGPAGDQTVGGNLTVTGNETVNGNETVAGTLTVTGLLTAPIRPRITALVDGATITPNADTTDLATVTLGGNRTMAQPTGVNIPYGKRLAFRIRQDATGGRTLTWNAVYRFPGGMAPILTGTAAKTDYFEFISNEADATWDLVLASQNL